MVSPQQNFTRDQFYFSFTLVEFLFTLFSMRWYIVVFLFSLVSWIQIKDLRGIDGRAERLSLRVLCACYGSERCIINIVPYWWTVPQAIPMLQLSKRQTKWHRTDNHSRSMMLNFLFLSLFPNSLISFSFEFNFRLIGTRVCAQSHVN